MSGLTVSFSHGLTSSITLQNKIECLFFSRKQLKPNFSCLIVSLLQLSFQMWTNQMQDTLNSKKHGDTAFRAKDFASAIDCYTQVSHLFACYVLFSTKKKEAKK